jgi:hypothetical protein
MIDLAFADYAAIEAMTPPANVTDVFSDFRRMFISAWKANQAFALNGLVPQPSEDLLFHAVNVWNRAHSNAVVENIVPGDRSTLAVAYIAHLIQDIAHQNFPNVPIVNGRLRIYIGPRKNPPVRLAPLTLHTGSKTGISLSSSSTRSLGKSLLVGSAIVLVSGAAGIGVWALVTHQSYLGALKGIWRSTGGAAVRKVNPLPALAAAEAKSTTVQTLLFPRPRYSESRAKGWARAHNYLAHKTDITDHYIRLRQRPPSAFKSGSFRTITLGNSGVKAVVGHLR